MCYIRCCRYCVHCRRVTSGGVGTVSTLDVLYQVLYYCVHSRCVTSGVVGTVFTVDVLHLVL